MKGTVNAALEIMIPVELEDASGQRHIIPMHLDTAYNGFVTLPPPQIAALRLPWEERIVSAIADGSSYVIDVYSATLIWNGQPYYAKVDAIDHPVPLIGTALLERHRLNIEMIPGGTVTIDPLP
jgi:predicted aspartyl protease